MRISGIDGLLSRQAPRRVTARSRSMMGRCTLLLSLLCVTTFSAAGEDRAGIVPLSNAREYPYSLERDDFSLGVKVLSPDEVEKLFASTLNRGYVVLEVAVYPGQGKAIESPVEQFILREEASRDYARAASPRDAARALQKANARRGGRDVTLYPQAGVGYSSGPSGPYYDGGRGWHTSVGVGVGIGPTEPEASTSADRGAMETELSEKGLPAGTLAKPVAGYVYFPITLKKPQQARLELEFLPGDPSGQSSPVRVSLHR